jgi:hypothetical protein
VKKGKRSRSVSPLAATRTAPSRISNPQHYMTAIGAPPSVRLAASITRRRDSHAAQCATQWDSLAHVHYDDLLTNGPRREALDGGTSRNGIDRPAETGITCVACPRPAAREGPEAPGAGTAVRRSRRRAREAEGRDPRRACSASARVTRRLQGRRRSRDASLAGAGSGIACIERLRAWDVAAICADNTAIK